MTQQNPASPDIIWDYWFPNDGHYDTVELHLNFWRHRMMGGVDEYIIDNFADLTLAAARGELDHWAKTPRGRLALIIALDQFPRSLWRDTAAAFGQDIKTTRLALEGIENGHYHALENPWERNFYIIAISHCEGPDHLARMDLAIDLADNLAECAPEQLKERYAEFGGQPRRVRAIIERFGRHAHRNNFLGRVSTPDEETYIATNEFPHNTVKLK